MPGTGTSQDEVHRSGPTLRELRARIEAMLSSGNTLPPERQLSGELNAPRSRIRRVLAHMRAEGDLPPAQVGRRAKRDTGPQVNDFVRITNPTDVIELRLILEPQLARFAAVRASAVQTARIMKAAVSAPDASYGAADVAFHLEVASASRNALGHALYGVLRKVGADSRVRLADRREPCPKRRMSRDLEHLRIAKAIAARDPEGAEHAMRDHLANVQAVILDRQSPETLEPGGPRLLSAAS